MIQKSHKGMSEGPAGWDHATTYFLASQGDCFKVLHTFIYFILLKRFYLILSPNLQGLLKCQTTFVSRSRNIRFLSAPGPTAFNPFQSFIQSCKKKSSSNVPQKQLPWPMVGCLKTGGVSCTAWPLLTVTGLGPLVLPSQPIEVLFDLFGSWVSQIFWLFDILSILSNTTCNTI
jgi:hypothetical protein